MKIFDRLKAIADRERVIDELKCKIRMQEAIIHTYNYTNKEMELCQVVEGLRNRVKDLNREKIETQKGLDELCMMFSGTLGFLARKNGGRLRIRKEQIQECLHKFTCEKQNGDLIIKEIK